MNGSVNIDQVRAYLATMRPEFRATARVFKWHTSLDNYEPQREFEGGHGVAYVNDGQRCYVLFDTGTLMRPGRCNYVIDDGKAAVVAYVSGWTRTEGTDPVFTKELPVNPDGRTRLDNGEVITYDTWLLGPRLTYHLKVSYYQDLPDA